jgi:hypothetical protein
MMNKLLRQKITKLRQEKEQLRLFLHEIIEAYYRVVNKPKTEPITTDNENPCPANLYSFFGNSKLCSCKPKTNPEKQHFKDCSLSLLKDFYEQTKGGGTA